MSPEQQNDILSINKVQLLLSEKRTALSVMRTGIAVLALPLSIFSALIARSMRRMRQFDRLIANIKYSHDSLRRLIKS